ncbi:hypothetical protein EXIGLDRAFT_769142 [Exidia glandulosa HHB12029]|uniref:Peptidase S28 n=1 Tax=Exidia glandulosa HHB12029 TaxID=1314781 RepID=A0A165HPK6_EXIGL|nr:hypothetical protein EXIGLDRAFT_769142 [Exidia glandulosa HHB12029]
MRLGLALLFTAAAASLAQPWASPMNDLLLGAQSINLWQLDQLAKKPAVLVVQGDPQWALDQLQPTFKAQWFKQPLDHFDKSRKETFLQRFWVSDRHYKPGGPVIVLDGGETSGENRLPFLDTGIVDILANATNGLGVVLEHRYYGRSTPVLNLTTDALRFLNNNQSAADSANFMADVKFEGIDADLTAPGTPWIYYGGSYAGARAAHMRVLYPDLTFGAMASSAVTHATVVYWEYLEVIRLNAPQDCVARIQSTIELVDRILDVPFLRKPLKGLFGLADLEHDDDFVSVLRAPLSGWQGRNWDPAVGSTAFEEFCATLLGDRTQPAELGEFMLDVALLNYATWIKAYVSARCPEDHTVEECFGTYDPAKYADVSLSNEWRLWRFQVCTEWGYFMTAPPDPDHPRIVSRRITLEYVSKFCPLSYPPGEFFSIPPLPEVDRAVNSLGDFALAADRLAFIDGTADPWMPATPHSWYAPVRKDTVSRPFKSIQDAVHHWDENGLPNPADEPRRIREIHEQEVDFVTAWLKDFNASGADRLRAEIRKQYEDIMRLDILS